MNVTWIERAPYILVIGVLVVSFAAFKKIMDPQAVEKEEIDYSYEMPRTKAEAAGFSFAGRKIIRKYKGFDDEVETQAHLAPAADEAKSLVPNSVTAKVDPKAKGKDDKKNAKKDGKKDAKNDAKNEDKKKNNKLANQKKPQMSVSINANSNEYNNKLKGFSNDSETNSAKGTATYYPNTQANRTVGVAPVDDGSDDEKLSVQQWRAILSQPNAKNLEKFLAAYKAKQVDDASFYMIANELYNDTAADRHKAGFELYKATPSVKSFTALLSQVQETSPEPQKAEIMGVLKTYAETAKFGILNQLLYSSDARVVQTAQSLIAQALAKLQNNTQTQPPGQISGREIRSPGSAPASAASFASFLQGLKRLAASNNASISAQARSLIEAITALKTP